MKSTKKIAVSGLMCALSVLIMLIGSFFQTLDLSVAAVAGLTVVFAMIELGKSYAFLIYAVSSVLSLMLLSNRTPALVFATFGGIYPILKAYLQKIKNKWVCYAVKLVFFNVIFSAIIFVGKNLFLLPDELLKMSPALYLLGNVTYILYDLVLDKMIILYAVKLKRIFDKSFRI